MKIISNYKDYYDGCQKYGIDTTIQYIRKEQNIDLLGKDLNLPTSQQLSLGRTFYNNFIKSVSIIGFCGKLYPYFTFINEQNVNDIHIINNIKDMCIFIETHLKKEEIKSFYEEKKHSYFRHGLDLLYDFTHNMVNNYFNTYSGSEDSLDLFDKYKVPIFKVEQKEREKYTLTLNPNLKELNFMKLIDPFTAYQEIEMFISGVIGVQNPELIQISDKYKIEKKGFDKWSFRKQSKK